MNINIPSKFKFLFRPYRYKAAFGGRGGAKTESFCRALLIKGAKNMERIVCARELLNSIDDSVKPTLEAIIHKYKLGGFYTILHNRIVGKNGTTFRFKGMSRNIEEVKGWKFSIFYMDEARTCTQKTLEILRPSIREADSELWFSWNPKLSIDPIDVMFRHESGPPSNSFVQEVSYKDNPYFNDILEQERIDCLRSDPDRYPHIWEGEYDDAPDGRIILPYAQLLKCVDAHKKLGLEITGTRHAGYDISDEGNDRCGHAVRKGPLLEHCEDWTGKGSEVKQSTARMHRVNVEMSVMRLFYDSGGGYGSGVRSDLRTITGSRKLPYFIHPFRFGGAVNGPDRTYIRGVKNKDFFKKQNAQAWWNIRLRMLNTLKLLDGDNVDQDKCLFINGGIDKLNPLLVEMSRATFDEDSSSRIIIDKAPDGSPSPNLADSVIMSFAHDIRRGLKS